MAVLLSSMRGGSRDLRRGLKIFAPVLMKAILLDETGSRWKQHANRRWERELLD